MLIPYNILVSKYKMKVNGILHIGAHDCEEMVQYITNGCSIDKIIWVEGNPNLVEKCKKKYNNIIIKGCVISNEDNKECSFNITNNGQSSSILELGTHKKYYPHINFIEKLTLKTKRIDTMYKEENISDNFANFLNIDIQGAELLALKGMGELLNNFDYVYLEVNREYLYKNCCLVGELDEYLGTFDFKRIDTIWTDANWGDAIYIKNTTPSPNQL